MTSKLTASFSFLLLSTMSFGQAISKLVLNNKQPILNGRAFLHFPANAKNVARATDIMAADPNANRETRIMMDIGKERLVFFARELYVTSKKESFFEAIKKNDKDYLSSKLLSDKDSFIAVLSVPLRFDSAESAILIGNLTIRAQDGSVFSIGAFINPEAFKNRNEYQKLSETIFNTLTKGPRKLMYSERTESYSILGGKKSLRIKVPQGYIITKDSKYDFEVLQFQKVKDISDTTWQRLTVYMGNYPSYFYGEYDFTENDAQKISGQFNGKNVEWMNFKNVEKRLYLKEQKIPGDSIEKGLILHIAMLGNNSKMIEELTQLVENIQVKE
jgi:hypothetical protein